MKLKWTKGARSDLVEIVQHISMDRPQAARRMAARRRASTQALKGQAELGRVVPELGNEKVRERIVRPYRIIYRVAIDQIEILAVVHSKRLLRNVGLE